MLIVLVFPVKAEREFSVDFSDFDSIHIFQCKEGVHKTKIGVNVRNIDCSWADIEDLCHFFDQVSFGSSGFCFILCHTNIRSLSEEPQKLAKLNGELGKRGSEGNEVLDKGTISETCLDYDGQAQILLRF